MSEQIISKNQILSELSKSPHGNYKEYIPVGVQAAKQDPEFLAHLISWNRDHADIRDCKVALPMVSLSVPEFSHPQFVENSLAHLALLDPRNLLKALKFGREVKTPGHNREIVRMAKRYLKYREADWGGRFTRNAIQHRAPMKELYWMYRVKHDKRVNDVLFGLPQGESAPKGTIFEGISRLKDMAPAEAAGFIIAKKIPFLTAKGALGDRIKDPDILMALVERMSPTELTTNAKQLEKLGMKNMPAVRGAFDKAMVRAAASTKNVLKTTKAVESVEDESLKEKLRGLQEKQVAKISTIEGDWAVLGDKSGSMAPCIEAARHVAGTLAKLVKGKVYLIFFDASPRFMEVTGKTYEEIKNATATVMAQGGTSIGCGVHYLLDRKISVDGIAVISDAQENTSPKFFDRYQQYVKVMGNEPSVYLYRCGSYTGGGLGYRYVTGSNDTDLRDSMKLAGIDLQEFQLGTSVDYYAIPGIAKTMTVKKWDLVEQVLNTPLITLDMVFGGEIGKTKRKEKAHA